MIAVLSGFTGMLKTIYKHIKTWLVLDKQIIIKTFYVITGSMLVLQINQQQMNGFVSPILTAQFDSCYHI